MNYRVITEDGREIKRFATEQEAERYWDRMNGIYIDENDNEFYIYVEQIH